MYLADAEFGFDAGHAIVNIDNFADEGFELVVQSVEACIHVAKTRLHTIESSIYAVESLSFLSATCGQ